MNAAGELCHSKNATLQKTYDHAYKASLIQNIKFNEALMSFV